MPAAKAHTTVMKRISSLPEEEKSILIAKYEGAEASETQTQNNILMMLLRTHFETKQAAHTHLALPGGGVKLVYFIIALWDVTFCIKTHLIAAHIFFWNCFIIVFVY